MRNLSLDQFYRRIKGKILLVGAYIEDKSITNIITSCRLKPASAFTNKFNETTTLEPLWVDEFDNNIELKNKKLKINLHGKRWQTTSTDIFCNETIEFVLQHSSTACIGLYPDSENFILLLKGSDNYFRCYTCQNDKISICSPLVVGLKILRFCSPKHLKYFQKLTTKSEMKNLKQVEWIITALPAQELLLPNITNYKKLRSLLYNE